MTNLIAKSLIWTSFFVAFTAEALNIYPAGAISTGLGGMGFASAEPSESANLNPASLVHVDDFTVSFSMGSSTELFNHTTQQNITFTQGQNLGVVPAAILLTQGSTFLNQESFRVSDVAFAFASYLSHNFSIGTLLRHNSLENEQRKVTDNNISIGLMWTPFSYLGLGIVGHDLLAPDAAANTFNFRPHQRYGLGMTFLYEDFARFRWDTLSGKASDWTQATQSIGLETMLSPWLVFRLGYRWAPPQDFNSVGLGFNAARFYLQLSHLQARDLGEKMDVVDLILPF